MSSIPLDPVPPANALSFNAPYGDLSKLSKDTRTYHLPLEISMGSCLATKSSFDSSIDIDIHTDIWKESAGVAMCYLH